MPTPLLKPSPTLPSSLPLIHLSYKRDASATPRACGPLTLGAECLPPTTDGCSASDRLLFVTTTDSKRSTIPAAIANVSVFCVLLCHSFEIHAMNVSVHVEFGRVRPPPAQILLEHGSDNLGDRGNNALARLLHDDAVMVHVFIGAARVILSCLLSGDRAA